MVVVMVVDDACERVSAAWVSMGSRIEWSRWDGGESVSVSESLSLSLSSGLRWSRTSAIWCALVVDVVVVGGLKCVLEFDALLLMHYCLLCV